MTIDITILIAVLGFALSVGTFFIGRVTAAKTDGIAYDKATGKVTVYRVSGAVEITAGGVT
jgi:hypothetical protein